MSKKPLEILLLKIIKETLLLEEVNEEKISYHVGLMTSAVQSEEGKAFIQSNLKRVVIGMLKQTAIAGSPGEIPLTSFTDIAKREVPEFTSQLLYLAEIDQSADSDLYDILVTAMAHFINALIDTIGGELPKWLLYGDRNEDFKDQMFFIDNDGNVIDGGGGEEYMDVTGIRFVYEPNEKIEFMKKFAQVLMEIADDRFRYCWGRIPDFELSEYDVVVGDLFADPVFF